MRKALAKALIELVNEQVLSPEKADEIRAYYQAKNERAPNRLMIVFGILGALLVGLGVILIFAHNWDDLSRSTKTILAFVPLLMGQLACGYSLWKQRENISWREGSSTFLIFAIGANISLISQIYHISGSMSGFILTWALLSLPLVYVLRSSMSSIFYLIGISWYAWEIGYWHHSSQIPFLYPLLLLLVLPHYYLLYKKSASSNFTSFYHWLVALSLITVLGTVATDHEEWIFVAYMSLFGILFIIGSTRYFKEYRSLNNGPAILGSTGTILLLIFMSFHGIWRELADNRAAILPESLFAPEFIIAALLSFGAITLFFILHRRQPVWEPAPLSWISILFIPIFFTGLSNPLTATVLINVLLLLLGLYHIRQGTQKHHLGRLNFGLLIISTLIICRFFDTNISFVLRGFLFVALGVSFFAANYIMLKKKSSSAKKLS